MATRTRTASAAAHPTAYVPRDGRAITAHAVPGQVILLCGSRRHT